MKKTAIYIFIIYSFISVSLFTAGCSDDFKYSKDYSVYDGVVLNINSTNDDNSLNLNLVNKTYRVRVNVNSQDVRVNSQDFLYEIEDETIATIDGNGLITMLREGETKLGVKIKVKPEIATSCTINVKPITANKLNVPAEITVKEGKTFNLAEIISITPSSASNDLDYKIADGTVASISSDGVVKGLSIGNSKITVSTKDGSNLTEEIDLTVAGYIYVESLEFSEEIGEKTYKINDIINLAKLITVLPENAENKEIRYSVKSGNEVITLTEEGTVTCKGYGKAVVLVETQDGSNVSSEVEINVYKGEVAWADHKGWTVTTSAKYDDGKNYISDGSTGKPEHVIDGKNTTFLSIRKPEWFTVNNKPAGDNKEIYFIINTGSATTFNYISYEHRPLNDLLAASEIEISGSNDGTSFTLIKDKIDTKWIDNKNTNYNVKVPTSTYRYIKVKVTDWIKFTGTMGSAIQMAEFNVGNLQ